MIGGQKWWTPGFLSVPTPQKGSSAAPAFCAFSHGPTVDRRPEKTCIVLQDRSSLIPSQHAIIKLCSPRPPYRDFRPWLQRHVTSSHLVLDTVSGWNYFLPYPVIYDSSRDSTRDAASDIASGMVPSENAYRAMARMGCDWGTMVVVHVDDVS